MPSSVIYKKLKQVNNRIHGLVQVGEKQSGQTKTNEDQLSAK